MDLIITTLSRHNAAAGTDPRHHFRALIPDLCSSSSSSSSGVRTGGSVTIELCADHPHRIVCTVDPDLRWVSIREVGDIGSHISLRRVSFDVMGLEDLRTVLRFAWDEAQRETLMDWEADDWVSAGYPFRPISPIPSRVDCASPSYRIGSEYAPSTLWSVSVAGPPPPSML